MNENLISLYKDIEDNKISVKDTESILIADFLKNNISCCCEFEPFVDNVNFKYLGDISKLTYDEVKEIYSKYYKDVYACNRFLHDIKNTMHFNGLVFREEYKEISGVDEDLVCIKLEDISDFPSRLYRIFYRNGIYTLGDLLSTDYNDVIKTDFYSSKIKGLGEKGIKQVIDYVHSIGFLLKNEDKSADYIIKKYKSDGVFVVSDIINDSVLCNILFSNKIYTVDDLKAFGTEVLNLSGIGPNKRLYLKKVIKSLDDFVNEDHEFNKICFSIEALLDELDKKVKLNDKQLKRKEKIINRYDFLLLEMERNRERERELDEQMANKINEYEMVYKK